MIAKHAQFISDMGEFPFSLFVVCLVIIIMGGIGGFAGGLYNNKCNHSPAIDGWKDIFVFIMSGIICAFGVVIVFTCAGSMLDDKDNFAKGLYLVGISLMSGFFAMRLLPRLGNHLEKKIDDLSAKTSAVEKKGKDILNYHRLITVAETAFSTESKGDIDYAIREIEGSIDTFCVDRTLNIYLGRLYRRKKEYDKAIQVLKRFISHVKKLNRPLHRGNRDSIGVAYFNIACYHYLKSEDKKQFSDDVINALRKAIKYDPSLRETAESDEDIGACFKNNKENFEN